MVQFSGYINPNRFYYNEEQVIDITNIQNVNAYLLTNGINKVDGLINKINAYYDPYYNLDKLTPEYILFDSDLVVLKKNIKGQNNPTLYRMSDTFNIEKEPFARIEDLKEDINIVDFIKDYSLENKFIHDYILSIILDRRDIMKQIKLYEGTIVSQYYGFFFSEIGLTINFNSISVIIDCGLLQELYKIKDLDIFENINLNNIKFTNFDKSKQFIEDLNGSIFKTLDEMFINYKGKIINRVNIFRIKEKLQKLNSNKKIATIYHFFKKIPLYKTTTFVTNFNYETFIKQRHEKTNPIEIKLISKYCDNPNLYIELMYNSNISNDDFLELYNIVCIIDIFDKIKNKYTELNKYLLGTTLDIVKITTLCYNVIRRNFMLVLKTKNYNIFYDIDKYEKSLKQYYEHVKELFYSLYKTDFITYINFLNQQITNINDSNNVIIDQYLDKDILIKGVEGSITLREEIFVAIINSIRESTIQNITKEDIINISKNISKHTPKTLISKYAAQNISRNLLSTDLENFYSEVKADEDLYYYYFIFNIIKIFTYRYNINKIFPNLLLGDVILNIYIYKLLNNQLLISKDKLLKIYFKDFEKSKIIYEKEICIREAYSNLKEITKPNIFTIIKYKYPYNVPDCVETTIRNFINLLIFENNNINYKKLKYTINPIFYNFYVKYNSITSHDTMSAHEEWLTLFNDNKTDLGDLFTDRDGPLKDLRSSYSNFAQILAFIFNINEDDINEYTDNIIISKIKEEGEEVGEEEEEQFGGNLIDYENIETCAKIIKIIGQKFAKDFDFSYLEEKETLFITYNDIIFRTYIGHSDAYTNNNDSEYINALETCFKLNPDEKYDGPYEKLFYLNINALQLDYIPYIDIIKEVFIANNDSMKGLDNFIKIQFNNNIDDLFNVMCYIKVNIKDNDILEYISKIIRHEENYKDKLSRINIEERSEFGTNEVDELYYKILLHRKVKLTDVEKNDTILTGIYYVDLNATIDENMVGYNILQNSLTRMSEHHVINFIGDMFELNKSNDFTQTKIISAITLADYNNKVVSSSQLDVLMGNYYNIIPLIENMSRNHKINHIIALRYIDYLVKKQEIYSGDTIDKNIVKEYVEKNIIKDSTIILDIISREPKISNWLTFQIIYNSIKYLPKGQNYKNFLDALYEYKKTYDIYIPFIIDVCLIYLFDKEKALEIIKDNNYSLNEFAITSYYENGKYFMQDFSILYSSFKRFIK